MEPAPTVALDDLPSLTNQSTIDVSGSTEADARIEISGGASTAEGTANTTGRFSVNVTLNLNQANNLSVVAIGRGGRGAAATATVIHDDVAPVAVSFDTPEFTNQNPFTVTGTAEAGATVRVTVGAQSVEGATNSSGNFAIPVTLDANASNTITATARDAAGNEGPSASTTVSHDGITPSLAINSPTATVFDTDGDLRVNMALAYSDAGPSGLNLTSLGVTNDGGIGGGDAKGGVNAGGELIGFFDSVDQAAAAYNARLEHEFPVGSNTLNVTVSDQAGNTTTQSVTFTVEGTEPTFEITQPGQGAVTPPPPAGFVISATYSDVAGLIDAESFQLSADRTVFGLLLQDGTSFPDIPAGTNLRDMFTLSDTEATYSFDGTQHAFPADANTLTGTIADRAGNLASVDAVTFNATAPNHNLMVILTSADPGTTGHAIPVGLINLSDLGGINFTFNFDPAVLTVDSVKTTDRVAFGADSNADTQGSSGAVTAIVLDIINGEPIPAGAEITLEFYVTIAAGAAAGDVPITLTEIAASAPNGNAVAVIATDGFITIN